MPSSVLDVDERVHEAGAVVNKVRVVSAPFVTSQRGMFSTHVLKSRACEGSKGWTFLTLGLNCENNFRITWETFSWSRRVLLASSGKHFQAQAHLCLQRLLLTCELLHGKLRPLRLFDCLENITMKISRYFSRESNGLQSREVLHVHVLEVTP